MAIKPFKRVDNYFAGFSKLRADSLDSQFNMIGSYLNKEVIPTLNTLTTAKIPGSINPAHANKFLQNVGDYTTRWAAINNDSFADNSLSYTKISKVNLGSVLAGNTGGTISAVNPSSDNQCLVSRVDNLPIWKKLNSSNIEDRSITGDSVADGTITNANLPASLLGVQLSNNSIIGNHFRNESITSNKIANSSLTAEKLDPSVLQDFPTRVWSNIIPNNYLSNATDILSNYLGVGSDRLFFVRKFLDINGRFIPNRLNEPTINYQIDGSKFMRPKTEPYGTQSGFSINHMFGYLNCATKLKDNSISPYRVAIYANSLAQPILRKEVAKLLADESVQMRHLTPELREKLERTRSC